MKKQNKKQTKNKSIDYIIILIFILSMIFPVIISGSQQYITQYGDDISVITWSKSNSFNDIFTSKLGTGYRPMMNFIYMLGYTLWGAEAKYYYLFSGILFAGSMIFLYLICKILNGKLTGIIAVSIYLFLDASFILISKINFIVTTAEIFFIMSAIYFSIRYYKKSDKKCLILSIILSIFAFLTKEPSILIIPVVNIVYILYNKIKLTKYHIILVLPFIYLFTELMFISPDIAVTSNSAPIFDRIINNIVYYIQAEIDTQFKVPYLLIFSAFATAYYYSYKQKNIKELILLCIGLIIFASIPIILTSQPVQPTYLAELNIGVVILIALCISESLKKFDKIFVIAVVVIILQLVFVPSQVSNMINYNNVISNNQNTFYETVIGLNDIPQGNIFYISGETRNKYGTYQINEDFFKQYIFITSMYHINVTINYNDAQYIILPSTSDIQIFQKEYPSEKLMIIKQIQHGNDYGFILRK